MHPLIAEIISNLHKYARQGQLSDIKMSFKKTVGAVGKRDFIAIVGYLPIYTIIFDRDPELFKQFIKAVSPEVLYLDKSNNNMFHYYISKGRVENLDKMLKAGMRFNSKNLDKKTPLHLLLEASSNPRIAKKVRKAYEDIKDHPEVQECYHGHKGLSDAFKSSPLADLGEPDTPPSEVVEVPQGETGNLQPSKFKKRTDVAV